MRDLLKTRRLREQPAAIIPVSLMAHVVSCIGSQAPRWGTPPCAGHGTPPSATYFLIVWQREQADPTLCSVRVRVPNFTRAPFSWLDRG